MFNYHPCPFFAVLSSVPLSLGIQEAELSIFLCNSKARSASESRFAGNSHNSAYGLDIAILWAKAMTWSTDGQMCVTYYRKTWTWKRHRNREEQIIISRLLIAWTSYILSAVISNKNHVSRQTNLNISEAMRPLLNQGKMGQLTEIPKSTSAYVGSGLPREKPMYLTEERGSGFSSSLAHNKQMSNNGLSSSLLVLRQGFAKLSTVALHS